MRPASVESRFDALHATGLTELVGREEELELLLRRWSKAKTGEGQVVLLSGEPGIGKSRLTAALLERLAAEPHTRLRYFCSPQHTDSALYPISNHMKRAAGFAHDDTAQAKLDKLDGLLAQSVTPREDAALIAEMLSLPNDGRYPTLELTAEQRRQKTLEALTAQLEALSRSNPVLMIFEDVHWLDPTSLEVLGRTVDRLKTLRVLLIITYRPEFEPPWVGRPYVSALSLNRLGEREIAAMIDRVAGNKPLPESVRQDIIDRTDGIPLFVEEMTKAMLEAAGEDATERMAAAIPLSSIPVPASLHASLTARLDRLGPAKEIAQIGSVIGREFSHALLAAVVRKPEVELQSALDGLVEAGLLFRQAMPPHASYLFKHALVQDAAYGTLLREPRRTLHSRIAQAVESQFGELAENQPELLARHYTEAGLTEKAIRYWLIAGRKSAARSAMLEAVRHMHRGLELVPILPAGPSRLRYELEFQSALGGALIAAKGASAAETGEAYYRARHLCQELGDTELLISVLSGLSTYHIARNEFGPARDVAEHLLHLAQTRRAAEVQLVANRAMGACLCHLGEFTSSAAYLLRALTLYAPEKHRSIASVAGYDARVSALNWLMIDLFALGQLDAAAARSSEVLQWSRELRYPNSTCFALALAVIHELLRRAYDRTGELIDQLTTVAKDQDFPFWRVVADIIRGYLIAAQGQPLSGLELSQRGLAEYKETGAKWMEAYFLYLISQCCEMADRMEEAVRLLDAALRTIDISGERWFAAELYRMKGDLSIAHSRERLAQTEDDYQHALQIARQQSAKSWELRAAMSLARLWRDQGKVQQARELLAPVYGWFTEGFDTRDLKEAKALLQQLTT
jgi:predicted ATPase